MTSEEFLAALRRGLKGLRPEDIDELVADYRNHFAEGQSAGRSEQDVAAALGDPVRLARELRTEAGLRRWESERSPGSFARALVALVALAALDLIILLPALFVLALFFFAAGVALVAITVAGVALVANVVHGTGDLPALGRVLAGLGLVSGGIGWGAALLLLLGLVLRLLGRYVRLHYQLIGPGAAAWHGARQ